MYHLVTAELTCVFDPDVVSVASWEAGEFACFEVSPSDSPHPETMLAKMTIGTILLTEAPADDR